MKLPTDAALESGDPAVDYDSRVFADGPGDDEAAALIQLSADPVSETALAADRDYAALARAANAAPRAGASVMGHSIVNPITVRDGGGHGEDGEPGSGLTSGEQHVHGQLPGADELAAEPDAGQGSGTDHPGGGGGRGKGGDHHGDEPGDNEPEDFFHVGEGYGRRILKSPEAMTREQLAVEYQEAIDYLPSDKSGKITAFRLGRDMELPLSQSEGGSEDIETRQAALDSALQRVAAYVALPEEAQRTSNGDMRLLHDGTYRHLVYAHVFADNFRARLEDRPLTPDEQANIYQGMAQLLRGSLIELNFRGYEKITGRDLEGVSEQGKVGMVQGAIAEMVGFTATARPGSPVLLVPSTQGYRANDTSVLFKDDQGRNLEIATDFKLSGDSGTRNIRLGREAQHAVYPGAQPGKAGRTAMGWDALQVIAHNLVYEQQGRSLNPEDVAVLDHFTHSIADRVRQLGVLTGVPDILQRVRY